MDIRKARRGRRPTERHGEREAADAWEAGQVTVATEPTAAIIGGLIIASGLPASQCAREWGVSASTLLRWRDGGGELPSRLQWWGMVAWWTLLETG